MTSSLTPKDLGECLLGLGRGQSPTYVEDESPIHAINQKCVRNGAVDTAYSRAHDPLGFIKEFAVLQDGDVCINSTGTGTIGRIGLWAHSPSEADRYFADSHVTIARPNTAVVNPRYLTAVLQSPAVQTALETYCFSGSTNQVELNKTALSELELCLLPRDEQNAVAEVMARLDHAIDQTEALIAKQQRIKNGLMQNLLTRGIDEHGNIRSEATHAFKDSPLGRVPVEWDVRSCAELCTSIVVGIVIRPTQYYKDSGVPILRSANVRENRVTTDDLVFMSEEDNRVLKKSQVRKGDLVTIRTGYPGTTAVVPQELNGANCVDIVISRPDTKKVRSHYLAMWINSDFGKKQVLEGQGGLAQQHFNVGQMKKLLVKTPPIITREQEQIENILLAHRENNSCLFERLEKLRRHKVGLLHDLLTGERRITPLLAQAAT